MEVIHELDLHITSIEKDVTEKEFDEHMQRLDEIKQDNEKELKEILGADVVHITDYKVFVNEHDGGCNGDVCEFSEEDIKSWMEAKHVED